MKECRTIFTMGWYLRLDPLQHEFCGGIFVGICWF